METVAKEVEETFDGRIAESLKGEKEVWTSSAPTAGL